MYDAHTGQLLQTTKPQALPNTKSNHKIAPSRLGQTPLVKGTSVDGVTRRKSATVLPIHKPSANNTTLNKPIINSTRKEVPKTPQHQSSLLQKSYTLHRKAVHKPSHNPKPHIHSKSMNSNGHSNSNFNDTQNKVVSHVPEPRLQRALNSSKSNVISKFGSANPHKSATLSPHLSVKPTPNQQISKTPPSIPPPAVHHLSNKNSNKHKPQKFVFEDQVQNANAHLLKPVKKARTTHKFIRKLHLSPKSASVMAGFAALIILGSFFAYQRIPTISMRVAANQAGFMGTIPSKVPAGYAFAGPVKAIDNAVAVTYKSSSDDRQFVLSQRQTNWSSEALLTNFLQESKLNYQVYKENGLTVYVYDGSNATWVDNGVWYNVNANQNSLSSSQLLEIAASS